MPSCVRTDAISVTGDLRQILGLRRWRPVPPERICARSGEDLAGDVVLPGDDSWDAARQAWNLAVDQKPVAVVLPESADDIVATVGFAGRERSPDRLQRGRTQRGPDRLEHGHPAAEDRADEEHRDRRAAQRARVEAGVLGKPLAQAAGKHGLCYLSGTSPDVGIVGYTLGGGFSWMIRKYGLACEQRARGRARHGRRTTRPRRQGQRARPVLGGARRRGQLRQR